LTVVVPRHPERGTAVAETFTGWAVTRRGAGHDPPDGGVWVGDTMGEMGLYFRLAPVVFMGKSLVAEGGQNPLEPARLGCAVATGPHAFNFAGPVAALRAAGALAVVDDAAALADWAAALLRDPARRAAMGEAGQAAAARHAGLPAEVAAMLLRLMHAPA
jgi:3-deoxy-D-manno-octulosonic-acid transferase